MTPAMTTRKTRQRGGEDGFSAQKWKKEKNPVLLHRRGEGRSIGRGRGVFHPAEKAYSMHRSFQGRREDLTKQGLRHQFKEKLFVFERTCGETEGTNKKDEKGERGGTCLFRWERKRRDFSSLPRGEDSEIVSGIEKGGGKYVLESG